MIEPDYLSVPELAERWKQTPRQIIDHALSLRFALYFLFDGLAFDFDNYWYSSTGAHSERREFEDLQALIESSEAHLVRNARGLTGQFDRLGHDDVVRLRAQIDRNKARVEELRRLLEEREAKIKQFHYRGHLRVAPATLTDIARNGETDHPLLAYHPHFPVQLRKTDRGVILDGTLMRLESYGDWKPTLAAGDLLASMNEIRALESATPARPGVVPGKRMGPASNEEADELRSAVLSSSGRLAAQARHKDTNEKRVKALAEWEEEGPKYSGMAAFARLRHKAYEVAERTLYKWISDSRKNQ